MVNKIKGSNVLVTGGAGFIGSALTEELLALGCKTICLDNFSTGKRKNIESFLHNGNYTLIEGDIRSANDCKKAVSGVDFVFHQAALGSVPRSVKDPVTTNDVNIGGFITMLTAAKDEKVKRFIYASSSAVYGDHPKLPKSEEATGNPLSPYAVTKKVNELYASVFAGLYGIEVTGLRYFNVFGRRQDPEGAYAAVIPRFIHAYLNGQSPQIFGDGTQSRDFTYIDNVVQANLLAAISEMPSSVNTVYNIAYGEATTLNSLADIIRGFASSYYPKASDLKPIYTSERKGDIPHSLASIDKARKLLGYSPQFSLISGLGNTVQWYKERYF